MYASILPGLRAYGVGGRIVLKSDERCVASVVKVNERVLADLENASDGVELASYAAAGPRGVAARRLPHP